MFNSDVTLPAGLEISAIGKSIEFVERELSESHFIDIYLEGSRRLPTSQHRFARWQACAEQRVLGGANVETT